MQVTIIKNLYLNIVYIGAYFFLDETLHTKIKNRRGSRSEASSDSDPLLSPSLDSGIEMSQQGEVTDAEESDVEPLVLSETIQIVESDIDSQSDFEDVSSSTELLLEERRNAPDFKEQVKYRNTLGFLGRTKYKLRSCNQQCKSCITGCLACTPKKACTLIDTKLRAGWSKLKMMLSLIRDRRVIVSTSLYGILAFASIMSQEVRMLLQKCLPWCDLHQIYVYRNP